MVQSVELARRVVALAAVAVIVPWGAACTIAQVPKGDSRCTISSACANDPPTTASDVDECNDALAGPCAAPYRALLDCVAAHQTCGPDQRSDPGAIQAACGEQDSAYKNCVPAPPGGATPDASRPD